MDVFVLTSRMEAKLVSILEAMAAGLPVVAPRVGSIDESLAEGVTGFMTEPGCVEPVAERLIELLEDPVRPDDGLGGPAGGPPPVRSTAW